MNKLTKPQRETLEKLTSEWKTPYTIGASMATLNALVKKGYVEVRRLLGSMAFPRTSILYRKIANEK